MTESASGSVSPAGPAQGGEVLLRIENLNKRFGGLVVAGDISIDLRAGMVTTLVGPNGAGKTTLFNMITGHLTPDSGSIFWQGQSIVGKPHWQIARMGIARTFQDLRLFDQMSVEENVLTVMERSPWFWQRDGIRGRDARRQRTTEILEATGLSSQRATKAIDLSYAERKFLSMARVMATDARIWMLDEPASGLDRGSYDRFLALLRAEVAKGVTICIIEHNLDIVINISDRIAFLDQGRLLADDEPQKILNDPKLAAIYFGELT